ncbi:hypothetical protein FK518_27425 [Klebsiella pneumoniae]|nr:hypothetical protein [Klebsiella pneumoniae]
MNTDKKVVFFLKDSKQNKSTEKNVDANKIKAIRRKQVATARKRKMMKNNVKRNGAMEKKNKDYDSRQGQIRKFEKQKH